MVEPQITIVKILADLNLAVRYGIAICKYEILVGFNLAIAKVDHQTAKFDTYCGFFPLSSESMDCKHTRVYTGIQYRFIHYKLLDSQFGLTFQ